MSTATLEKPVTIGGSNDCYEVVDGIIVEKEMGYRERFLAKRLGLLIDNFALANNLGEALIETPCLLPPKMNERIPDTGFISLERWPKGSKFGPGNALPAVPELAVEIISPTNNASEMNTKIHEYFGAGVEEVWIIYPDQGEVIVYESLDVLRTVRGNAVLKTRILPGFELTLSDLFPQ
jgi:Uma2 family endonuclease